MNFLMKIAKRSTSGGTENSVDVEEVKHNTSRAGDKKANEKQLAYSKVNINSVYNKEEDYKPLDTVSKSTYGSSQSTSEKNFPKFKQIVEEELIIDLEALKKLAWQGIPKDLRYIVWKILLKYIPLNKESRESTVARKRLEYANFTEMYVTNMNVKELDQHEHKSYDLIKKDVYRTQPDHPIFQHLIIQEMLIRLLWIWHVRHPASGYVQGINDLTTPFIAAFLGEYFDNINYDTFEIPKGFETTLTKEVVANLEADVYWCLCKILDGILDNYTFSQSGTQKSLTRIKEITKRIDLELYSHLETQGVNFTFFSFRWIFCLLIREFPLKVGMRLFDTYISDEQGFSILHIYVCVAMLLKWSIKLKKMDFNEIMLFLQKMPTNNWSEKDIEVIISEAYVFQTLYEDSQGHLATSQQFGSQSTRTSIRNELP